MKIIDHSYQTLYSELAQRSLDAQFTSEFSLDGRFIRMESRGRWYWYFDTADDHGGKKRRYVGPVNDEAITQRVNAFKDLKSDHRARRKLVSTLVREAYLPQPLALAGDIINALAAAGFFRLRGVLVGTMAYQCYSAALGVRLPRAVMQTGDADFAQFHSISMAVGDSLPPVIDVLRSVDETFRQIPNRADNARTTQYATRSGFRVDFLTPNLGSDDYQGKPPPMPALGGAAAQPLRFLDFLIYQPIRAIMLHKSGIPILVPAPERYAIHKLIVGSRGRLDHDGMAKSRKDLLQAQSLIEALFATRQGEALADAYMEAWDREPAWRDAIKASLRGYDQDVRLRLETQLSQTVATLDGQPENYGLEKQ